MSLFYQNLPYVENVLFKQRKKAFKKDKPCAICGKLYPPELMMVAHITPVRELSDYDALYDTTNWEVRCINCEHKMNRDEASKKKRQKLRASELAVSFIPGYEVDLYGDYDQDVQRLWEKVCKRFNNKKKHRRSAYMREIKREVGIIDNFTLARATARYILCNHGKIPVAEEVFAMLTKDVEWKMMFAVDGKFKKEKEQK